MPSNDIAVAVRGLSKAYTIAHEGEKHVTLAEKLLSRVRRPFQRAATETFWALKDVEFDIKKGDVVGIIGRNGAGKSTLLKILSRITEPTAGEIRLYGRVGSLLEVGTGFHPELTGRENIYLNGQILGMRKKEIDKQFDAIVAFAGVEKFLDTPVKRYSSGMYVRLAFAVAAHLRSEILIVDEVLAVGDSEFQKKCLGKMRDVSSDGRTVLFVSHNMGVVGNLCSRAILLAHGRLTTQGPVQDTLDSYIRSKETSQAERAWASQAVAPGNAMVRLKAVRLISNNECTNEVNIDSHLDVEMDIWNLQADAPLSFSIHLLDSVGTEVLASANFRSATVNVDPMYGHYFPRGVFRTRCRIPANFLNEGQYSINAVVLSRVSHVELICREVVQFTVVDTGSMRGEWGGRWIGVVRPRLEWLTSRIESEI